MKRSYPFSGGGGQQPASSSQTPDYSSYGYGSNAAIHAPPAAQQPASNAQQQAQWHEQWQQYYAQQAAAQAGAPQQQQHQQQPQQVHQQPYPAQQTLPQQPQQSMQQPQHQPQYYAQYAQPQQQQQQQHQSLPQQQRPQVPTWTSGPTSQPHATPAYQPQRPYATSQPRPQPFPSPQAQHSGVTMAASAQMANKRPRNDFGPRPGPNGLAGPAPIAAPQLQQGIGPNNSGNRQAAANFGYQQPQSSSMRPPIIGRGPLSAPGMRNVGPIANTLQQPAMMMGSSPPMGGMAQQPPMGPGGGPMRPLPNQMGGPLPFHGGQTPPTGPGSRFQGPTGPRNAVPPRRPANEAGASRVGRVSSASSSSSLASTEARDRSNSGILSAAGSSKFTGPVGVNALPPGSSSRNGALPNRRNGRTSHPERIPESLPSTKARNDSSSRPPQAPSGPRRNAQSASQASQSSFDVNKPAIIATQAQASTDLDHPVQAASKKTYADFNILGLHIPEIDWLWTAYDAVFDKEAAEQEDTAEPKSEVKKEEDDEGGDEQPVSLAKAIKQRSVIWNQREQPEEGPKKGQANKFKINFAVHSTSSQTAKSESKKAAEQGNAHDEKSKVTEDTEDHAATTDQKGPIWTAESKGPPQLSSNRIGLTYASGARRLVIDAEVVKEVRFCRSEKSAEIVIDAVTMPRSRPRGAVWKKRAEEWVICKGVLLESRKRNPLVENRKQDNVSYDAVSRRQLEHAWLHQTEDEGTENKDEEMGEGDGSGSGDEEVGKNEDTDEKKDSSKQQQQEQQQQDEEADEEESEQRSAKDSPDSVWGSHKTLPPLHRFLSSDADADPEREAPSREMVIVVALEKLSPLQEAKWLKTGDIAEWLAGLPSFSQTTEQAWASKIHVLDPDPPPSVHDLFGDWANRSTVSLAKDRRKFVADTLHGGASSYVEILAWLVHGDRYYSAPNQKELGPLLSTALTSSAYPSHQNHMSLSVLALFSLCRSYADAAGTANEVLEGQMGEIIMSLPVRLTFRALDGMFKDHTDRQRTKERQAERQKAKENATVASGASSVREDTSSKVSSRAPSVTPSLGGESVSKREGDEEEDGLSSEGQNAPTVIAAASTSAQDGIIDTAPVVSGIAPSENVNGSLSEVQGPTIESKEGDVRIDDDGKGEGPEASETVEKVEASQEPALEALESADKTLIKEEEGERGNEGLGGDSQGPVTEAAMKPSDSVEALQEVPATAAALDTEMSSSAAPEEK